MSTSKEQQESRYWLTEKGEDAVRKRDETDLQVDLLLEGKAKLSVGDAGASVTLSRHLRGAELDEALRARLNARLAAEGHGAKR